MRLGAQSAMEYENPQGKRVTVRFIGLAQLIVVYDRLEDGAELLYEEAVGVEKAKIRAMVRRKEDPAVFRPQTPTFRPDYGPAEVFQEVLKLMRH